MLVLKTPRMSKTSTEPTHTHTHTNTSVCNNWQSAKLKVKSNKRLQCMYMCSCDWCLVEAFMWSCFIHTHTHKLSLIDTFGTSQINDPSVCSCRCFENLLTVTKLTSAKRVIEEIFCVIFNNFFLHSDTFFEKTFKINCVQWHKNSEKKYWFFKCL